MKVKCTKQNHNDKAETTKSTHSLYLKDEIDLTKEISNGLAIKVLLDVKQTAERLEKNMGHLSVILRKLSEIHALHFPKEALQKQHDITERFLAEIITGMPNKKK